MNLPDIPPNPYILTLQLDEKASAFFDKQRQLYFPPKINYLQAHLTLFHYIPLPAADIVQQLQAVAGSVSAFRLQVADVVSLGKGVAYKLESKELQQLHNRLQQLWKPLLKPQDLQKLWPHITVQNKVTPQQASQLLAELKTNFKPFTVQANGLSIWEYLNGPWKFIDTISFPSTPLQ